MLEKKNSRLQKSRIDAGHTLVSLAAATGGALSASRIGNYESGTRQMRVAQARVLARVLGITPAYLLGIDYEIDKTEGLSEVKQELIAVIEKVAGLSDMDARQVTEMLKAYLRNTS